MYRPNINETLTALPTPVGYTPRPDLLVTMRPELPAPVPEIEIPKVERKAAPKPNTKPDGHREQQRNIWASVLGQVRRALSIIAGRHGAAYAKPVRIHSQLGGALTMDQITAACEHLVKTGDAVKRKGAYRLALACNSEKAPA